MTQKRIYLDHNATTPLKPMAKKAMEAALDLPGNASSVHKAGREARRLIETARVQVAALVNADPRAVIVFTSGATEANNMALRGSGCQRVIASAIEHPSVLSMPGVEMAPVLTDGTLDIAALDTMLEGNDRPTLLSVMLVNNETGVIQPIEAVVEIAKRRGALVHCDAVQAVGRIPVDIQRLGVDYLSLSAHKMGGPQGAGCLIMANCVNASPLFLGGGQEKGLRAGTENVAAIAGFGMAAELAVQDMAGMQSLAALRDGLEQKLVQLAPDIRFLGKTAQRVSNTSLFAVPGMPAEMQLIALDMEGICVSNGSACASGTVKVSHVLSAMGVAADEAQCAIRVSLGWNSTPEDVECFLSVWEKIYARVKSRRGAA